MKNEKLIIYIVIIIAVVALVYAFGSKFLNNAKVNVAPDKATAKQVSCDISVHNPFGVPLIKNGDLVIESVNCQQEYVSNCAQFGLFSQSGSLRLSGNGGLGSAVDVEVTETQSQLYTLTWCGTIGTKTLNLDLYNDNNENIYSKQVAVQ